MTYGCKNLPRKAQDRVVAVKLYDKNGNYIGDGTETLKPFGAVLCRNIGEYYNNEWHEDPQCEGCNPINKDWTWITEMRRAYEREVRAYRLRV